MIRTNLSTRPFYNERVVHGCLLVAALLVMTATVFNVTAARRYRRDEAGLAAQAAHDETRAAELQREAARLRASVDPKRVEVAATEAHQANDLIDRRTFSWTELLNRLESTLPNDAHIVAVRPKVDRANGIVLTLSIIAHDVEDVNQFMERLEETGAFKDPRPTNERFDDQGLFESQLEAKYTPGIIHAETPPAPAAGTARR